MTARFWGCHALLALLIAGIAAALGHGLHLETDILALLPTASQDKGLEQAQAAFAAQVSRRLILAFGSSDLERARAAAQSYAGYLRGSGAFSSVEAEVGGTQAAAPARLLPHRLGLLSDRHRAWLKEGHADLLRTQALRNAYSQKTAPTSCATTPRHGRPCPRWQTFPAMPHAIGC
jgi:predicted exporter